MAGITPDLERFLPFAEQLADTAAAIVAPYFRKRIAIDQKADATPVTIADREAEQAMRRMIQETFPDHGIEGEEYGTDRMDAEFVWCLDPIDGTKSFITGRPLFGTLVSLMHQGRPLLGIIDQCILKERWIGAAGRPSTWNREPIRVRDCAALKDAVLYTTTLQMFKAKEERAAFDRVEAAVGQPMYGGDCYAYGLLAMGFADLIVEADLDNHDFMALIPVIEGAGGIVTDWRGRPLGPGCEGRVIAAGDACVHRAALDLLAGANG